MNLMDVKGMHFSRPIHHSPVLITADVHAHHRPVSRTEPFAIDIKAVLVFSKSSCEFRCAIFQFSEFFLRENMEGGLFASRARGAIEARSRLHIYKICQHHRGIWITVGPGIETQSAQLCFCSGSVPGNDGLKPACRG